MGSRDRNGNLAGSGADGGLSSDAEGVVDRSDGGVEERVGKFTQQDLPAILCTGVHLESQYQSLRNWAGQSRCAPKALGCQIQVDGMATVRSAAG